MSSRPIILALPPPDRQHSLVNSALPARTPSQPSSAQPFPLAAELILVYLGVPLVLKSTWFPLPWLVVLLAIAACAAIRFRHDAIPFAAIWYGPDRDLEQRQLRRLLLRWLICGVLMTGVIWMLMPDRLFSLPRQDPLFWLGILAGYPVLSALPQELIYRAWFLQRYACLFRRRSILLAVNALAFGWLHWLFDSLIAVLLTIIGGWFFAETYTRTRSLRLVCLEHALYGNLIFTIGMESLFYHAHVLGT